MKEKIANLLKSLRYFFSKVFYPLLGALSLSSEKRISIELEQNKIKICKANPSKKQILTILEENFDFDKKINIKDNPELYLEKIKLIINREKLSGFDATVIIPTSEVKIKSIKIPTMKPLDLLEQAKDPEFWSQFVDVPVNFDEEVLSYQIISSTKATLEDNVLVAITNKANVEHLYNLLRDAGVNANVFEPKCFATFNAILVNKKNNKKLSFGLFEYGEKENYFIINTPSEVLFIENHISREDLVLIKQIEKIPDPTGPFWGEVYERVLTSINTHLAESGGITDKEGIVGFNVKEVFVHTEFDKSSSFLKGLQEKLKGLNLKLIKFFTNPAVENTIQTENIFDSDVFKFPKKLKKQFMETQPISSDFYPNVGAAIRFFNPFMASEPLPIKLKLNMHHMFEQIANNRRVRFSNSFLNGFLIVILLGSVAVIGITFPTYLQKTQTLVTYSQVQKDHENLLKEIATVSSATRKIETDRKLASKIIANKDEFTDLISNTPDIVPAGIEIVKLQYTQDDFAEFNGYALSDTDLNIFLENLRKQLGKAEITKLTIAQVPKQQAAIAMSSINPETVTANADQPAPAVDGSLLIELRNFIVKVNLKNG